MSVFLIAYIAVAAVLWRPFVGVIAWKTYDFWLNHDTTYKTPKPDRFDWFSSSVLGVLAVSLWPIFVSRTLIIRGAKSLSKGALEGSVGLVKAIDLFLPKSRTEKLRAVKYIEQEGTK